MTFRFALLVLLVAPLAALPPGGADGSTGCYPATDPDAVSLGGIYYVDARAIDGRYPPADAEVWGETNGAAGLQKGWSSCGYGNPMLPPDAKVLDSGAAFGEP